MQLITGAIFLVLPTCSCLAQQGDGDISFRDCHGAFLLCGDTTINMLGGSGRADFLNPRNDAGCLTAGERNSIWYYFEFDIDMPVNSNFEMLLSPAVASLADYNFSVYGPNLVCDSLGSPIRCSNFSNPGDATGLVAQSADFFETATGGDGFLAPLTVQPGEGYYLLIDYFNNFGLAGDIDISLTGSAVTHLNCRAVPGCSGFKPELPLEATLCNLGDSLELGPIRSPTFDLDQISWQISNGSLGSILQEDSVNPTFVANSDFSDPLTLDVVFTAGNCREEMAVTIKRSAFDGPLITSGDQTCIGQPLLLTSIAPGSQFKWSNGSADSTTTVSEQGMYYLEMVDTDQCFRKDSIQVDFHNLPEPELLGDTVFCAGSAVVLTTSVAWSHYQWSTGSTDAQLTVTEGGFYTISVTDENGCLGMDSTLVQSSSIAMPTISGPELFCPDEEVALSVQGDYTGYRWSTNEENPGILVGRAGDYGVTVTNAEGCIDSASITLSAFGVEPLQLPERWTLCTGEQLTVELNLPYETYSWSTGSVAPSIQIQNPGDFALTVSDFNGCQQSAAFSVVELLGPEAQIVGSSELCRGDTIQLSAIRTGASLLWSTGARTETIDVIEPGLYKLSVADLNGCVSSDSIQIVGAAMATPRIVGRSVLCPGEQLSLSVEGEFDSYLWSDGSHSSSIQVEEPGEYLLTVTNVAGCKATTGIIIEERSSVIPTISGSSGLCPGSEGVLVVEQVFSNYQWSHGESGPMVSINAPGVYAVTATDNHGCAFEHQFTVENYPVPGLSIAGPGVFCRGSSANLVAATSATALEWSNGMTDAIIKVVEPGMYGLTVTNEWGCSDSAFHELVQLEKPQPVIEGPRALCPGERIVVMERSDFPTYLWSSGEREPNIEITEAGVYRISVTDDNGCFAESEITITEKAKPEFEIMGDSVICEGTTSALSIHPASAAVLWSDGSTFSELLISQGGTYSATISGENGCSAIQNFSVQEMKTPDPSMMDSMAIDCRENQVVLTPFPGDGSDGLLFEWSGPGVDTNNESSAELTVTIPGTYSLVVEDQSTGCRSASTSVFIADQTKPPLLELEFSGVLDCLHDTVFIDGSRSAKGPGIEYHWLDEVGQPIPGAEGATFVATAEGIYVFEVKDTERNCTASREIFLDGDYQRPNIDAGPNMALTCRNPVVRLDGSQSIGNRNIAFNWYTFDGVIVGDPNFARPEVSEPGRYYLEILDKNNGCSSLDSVVVTDLRMPPVFSVPDTFELSCSPRKVDLYTDLEDQPRFYHEWRNPDQVFAGARSRISATRPGTYTVLVMDEETGCEGEKAVQVIESKDIPGEYVINVRQPSCGEQMDGSFILSDISGGTPPYQINFSGRGFDDAMAFDQLAAGNYEFTIKDAKGCEHFRQIELENRYELMVDIGDRVEVRLGEVVQPQLLTNIDPDSINRVVWSNGEEIICEDCWELPSLHPVSNQLVEVMVEDVNGCEANAQLMIVVERPYKIFAPSAFSPNGDGNNDRLEIHLGPDVDEIYSFRIFDRWGQLVFEQMQPSYAIENNKLIWEPHDRQLPQNAAVFVYMVEAKFIDGIRKVFSGDVLLVK